MILVSLMLAAAPAKAAAHPPAPPPPAQVQGDWFASLYTGEGIELRADERVFALFAMLNAVGYDQGPVTRKEPVPKVLYHPVRQQVRQRVIGGDAEVRKAADSFLDEVVTDDHGGRLWVCSDSDYCEERRAMAEAARGSA